jgi:hypothetical protein
VVASGTAGVTYSDVQGGYAGTADLNLDPLFVNAAAGDYHLGPLSPCIDAGKPTSDFSLEPEPDGGRINMGAYGNTAEAETKGWIYIDAYHIVRKTRVGRTLFEYDLTTTVRNASAQNGCASTCGPNSSEGTANAVIVTVRSEVFVSPPPSVACRRTVPAVAVQDAATFAVTVPAVGTTANTS